MEYEYKLLRQFTMTVGGTRCCLWLCDATNNFIMKTLTKQVETLYTKGSKECRIHTENGSSLEQDHEGRRFPTSSWGEV